VKSHKIVRKQPNSHFCFACGLENGFGLKARFYETEGGELIGSFRPAGEHQGYPGRLHGGLISTILDEVLARAIMVGRPDEAWGVTAELSVKYRQPVPLDAECRVIGRVTAERGRIFEAAGELVLADGSVAASATGRYFRMRLDQIGEVDTGSLQWRVLPEADDPACLEI
jgi:acyl-coenzyme A thioesterase PaaI-like protein